MLELQNSVLNHHSHLQKRNCCLDVYHSLKWADNSIWCKWLVVILFYPLSQPSDSVIAWACLTSVLSNPQSTLGIMGTQHLLLRWIPQQSMLCVSVRSTQAFLRLSPGLTVIPGMRSEGRQSWQYGHPAGFYSQHWGWGWEWGRITPASLSFLHLQLYNLPSARHCRVKCIVRWKSWATR